MKKLFVILTLLASLSVLAFEDHEHEQEEEHGHVEEKGTHEEKSSAVGPEKGITEKSSEGFKLAPEAISSFGLQMQAITASNVEIPQIALVEVKNEKSVYLVHEGWIRRVPAKIIKKQNKQLTIEVTHWQSGDQLIVKGVGFVRTSELVAEEGMAAGHSH